MTRIALDQPLLSQQVIVRGRFYERITERGFDDFDARLEYTWAGELRTVATRLAKRAGGWFALHLDSAQGMPDLALATNVQLVVTRPDGHTLHQPLSRDTLTASHTTVEIGGHTHRVPRIAGGPLDVEFTVEPAPVLLDGLVVLDHDLEQPAVGIAVRVNSTEATHTDAEGRFRIPALPLAESVTLQFGDDPDAAEHNVRPAWGRGFMSQMFSIPSDPLSP